MPRERYVPGGRSFDWQKTPVRRDRALAMKAGVRGSSPAAPTTVLERKADGIIKEKLFPKMPRCLDFLQQKITKNGKVNPLIAHSVEW